MGDNACRLIDGGLEMFRRDFTIACDWCKKATLDTGEMNVKSVNELALLAGWTHQRSPQTGKAIHICDKCEGDSK
jgi:hypothetical protein